MTVCEISINDALRRVEETLKTGSDPGFKSRIEKVAKATSGSSPDVAGEGYVDLAEIARDQIERKIASAFTGHDFARLVNEILKAQGYLTNLSPPGADNGIPAT